MKSDKELANSDNSQSTEGWSVNFDRNGESSSNGEISEPKSPNSTHRPDSGVGVGESVRSTLNISYCLPHKN